MSNASNASAVRAGKAFVELFADGSKLDSGLKAAERRLKAFGASVSGLGVKLGAIGAAGSAAILGAAYAFQSTTDDLADMAERTGIGIEALSGLKYAAERSDVSMEGLETGIKKMQLALYGASEGGREAQQALAKVGLSIEQLKNLSPDQQLMAFADAFKDIEDPAEKAALAVKIFGKQGTTMTMLLNQGSAGIAALKDEAARLGIVLGQNDVKIMEDFKAVMLQLKAAAMGVTIAIGQAVIPGLTQTRNLIMPVVERVTKFIRENKSLFSVLLQTATALTVAGASLAIFGKLIGFVGGGFGLLASALKVGASVGVLAFKAFAASFYFLLSPMGLVLAAVAGLTAAFLYLTETGAMIRAGIGDAFTQMAATFKQAWGGIVDAIKAGNLMLAFKIAVAGVKTVWYGLIDTLSKLWTVMVLDFKSTFYNVLKDLLLGSIAFNRALGIMSAQAADEEAAAVNRQNDEVQRKIAENRKNTLAAPDSPELKAAREELARLTKQAETERRIKNGARMQSVQIKKEKVGIGAFGASSGTFNASAALRLSAPNESIDKQQLDQLGRIDDKLADIREGVQQGGVFA